MKIIKQPKRDLRPPYLNNARHYSTSLNYELAATGSKDILWDWDIITDTVHLSSRWSKVLSYIQPESGLDFETFLSLMHEEDGYRIKKELYRFIRGET